MTFAEATERIPPMQDAIREARRTFSHGSIERNILGDAWQWLQGVWYGATIASQHGIVRDDADRFLEYVSDSYVTAMRTAAGLS